MSGYGAGLAENYDSFIGDVDYNARADYLLAAFERERVAPELLLDLGCGTGSLAVCLARRGISVIGVDASPDMLMLARDKAMHAGLDILFLEQDMRHLDLYGTVSGAVCSLDGINHLSSERDVRAVFERLRLFVQPGGLFVFDVNTEYKHREVLGDNSFVYEDEERDVLCVWRNRYDAPCLSTEIMLDFFIPTSNGFYERVSEDFTEQYYSAEALERNLSKAGFDLLDVFDDLSLHSPGPQCQRMTLIAKRMG